MLYAVCIIWMNIGCKQYVQCAVHSSQKLNIKILENKIKKKKMCCSERIFVFMYTYIIKVHMKCI